jgi:hypothetical protein
VSIAVAYSASTRSTLGGFRFLRGSGVGLPLLGLRSLPLHSIT